MFEEYNEDIQVWRLATPATGMADSTWTQVATVSGRIEPVSAGESYINNQNNQTASHILFLDVSYESLLQPQDGLIDPRGIEYINISTPEAWRNLLPYIMPKLEQKQFRIL
jgi:hypothetical protein